MSKNQRTEASNVYGGPQPKDQERAREYLRMLKETEHFDELWQIWRQLQRTQPEDRSVVKRAQPCPRPCEKHADNVYHAAKHITNQGFTFDLSDLVDLPPPVEEVIAPSVGPRIFSQKEQVNGIDMSPQQQMFAHSDRERHKVHMAVQYAFERGGETSTAYKYTSFPTLDAMVAYAETIPSDKPQCLFELARENRIVAPYMDVDCTLGAPAPHLLDQIVTELNEFTRKHLGRTPRIVCTDSSRDKGGGHYKNSWHIILHDIGGFRNGATDKSKGGDMRLFFEAFVASMGEDLKRLPEDTWDMSVYNKNSNMRCIGSHKADDASRTRLAPHSKYGGAQMSDYYVQQPGLKLLLLPPAIADRAVVAAPARKKQKTTHTTRPANVPKELGAYLQQQGMTIVNCSEMAPETDVFSAVPPKPAKLMNVKCVCPFTHRQHKSNHCYVIANANGAYIKCHDDACQGLNQRLDWVPPSDEPMQIEDVDATITPTIEPQSTDTGGEPEPESTDAGGEKKKAIADLLVWKISHPFYRLRNLTVGDDAPLNLTFEGRRSCKVGRRTVEIAEFSTTWQVCPNARVGLEGGDLLDPERQVRCDGRLKLTLIKDMPHVIRLGCPCCTGKEVKLVATDVDEEIEQLRKQFKENPEDLLQRSPTFDNGSDGLLVAPKGFHRDDTHVHELLWSDYDRVRGGLNHIAIFEDDANPTKIPHGTRCKMYIANELNNYAMRKQYHKRGAVVQVQSKHCPIAYETVLVGNDEMSFEVFIQQAERALPRIKETLKTQDYEKWATWCNVADHEEFPRLKPDRHLLAFSNVAVDITGGKMAIREFSECQGQVARAFNNIWFEPDYVAQPFDELLGKCPLFRMYIETHFPADLVERFNFKHRQGSEDWWIGKIFCAMLGRLLFEVNELDRWRTMLYILGPKNTGKSDLWRGIIQRFFDMANVYTYEKEPDKFSVAAMVGKEIAVAPDLKTQVQDAGTLQSMVCGEAVPIRNMRKIAESIADWKVPQLFISNLLPPWKKDESGALMSRFLIFQFRELQGETDTSLPQRIVQHELAVVFALIMRAYADLRAYVGTAPAEDWNLPYFNSVRASEEKRKQHLFRFLTEPRGNIRTKNAEIWIEPEEGEFTLLAVLKKKFDLYMKFQYPGVGYNWDEQFPDACLRKAAAHHEYHPGWKITNRETFTQCVKCGKDATKTYDQTVESGTCCCKWFYENKREGESWRALESRGIVRKGKTKASESPDKIKGLVIREEPFSEDGIGCENMDLSNFVWNGNCGCGRPAISKFSTKDGRRYYHCAFGCMEDANCSFRFKYEDELQQFLPINETNGHKWPEHPDFAPVRDMVSTLSR